MTMVDRTTSYIVGRCVGYERTEVVMQAPVDAAPQAVLDYSDDFSFYSALIYKPGQHLAMLDKSQTYRVEGDNAELRYYLARLARLFLALGGRSATRRQVVRLRLEPSPIA